jgi:hypothetical protein
MDDVASRTCLNMHLYCKCWSPIVLYVILNLSSRKRRDKSVVAQPVSRHCNSLTYSRLHKRRQGQWWSLSGGIIERFFFVVFRDYANILPWRMGILIDGIRASVSKSRDDVR